MTNKLPSMLVKKLHVLTEQNRLGKAVGSSHNLN